MAKDEQPKPPRIGTGTGYFIAGWVAIILGVFIGIGSSGSPDSDGGSIFATVLVGAGVGMIAVGFWIKLFGLVERRLVDIEQRLAPAPPTPTSAPEPPTNPEAGFDKNYG